MGLRSFHLVFILIAILGADLFGIWSFFDYARNGDMLILGLGILSLAGGLGLIFYGIKVLRMFDRADIH